MLYFEGQLLERHGMKDNREVVLIGVEETVPDILRRNLKSALSDWATCVVMMYCLYTGILFSLAVSGEALAMKEISAIKEKSTRNTDAVNTHVVGLWAGECIGFMHFNLHKEGLLTLAPEKLLYYLVSVCIVYVTAATVMFLGERIRDIKRHVTENNQEE